jgi:glycine betaine/proline transport system ATP-binding protein
MEAFFMTTSTADFVISCHNIWKIFGPHPQRLKQTLDPNLSRAEVLEQTGHVVAVKDVSFGVRKGETFVVMGLSGSGKSTLVRCISRLIEPTSGQVIIEGQDMTVMNEKQLRDLRRRKISMVFQHFGLFPHRKIIDNVAYGLEIQGIDKTTRHTRALEVLEMVSLNGWENHYPGELSGGMQQRVGIARALAVNPEILLFDEPFSALDPLIRREMQDELINLQQMMHKTIIFITHDFLEAVKLGDDIAIMKDGEVVQVGTPQQVIMNPADDYVDEFTKDVPRSRVLTASSIMQACEVVVSENDSPQQCLSLMEHQTSLSAFVQNENGTFAGICLQEQVNEAVRANQSTIKSVIDSHHPVVSPQTMLADLIPLIAASNVPVPVVGQSDNLLGAVDRAAVILAFGGDEKVK